MTYILYSETSMAASCISLIEAVQLPLLSVSLPVELEAELSCSVNMLQPYRKHYMSLSCSYLYQRAQTQQLHGTHVHGLILHVLYQGFRVQNIVHSNIQLSPISSLKETQVHLLMVLLAVSLENGKLHIFVFAGKEAYIHQEAHFRNTFIGTYH